MAPCPERGNIQVPVAGVTLLSLLLFVAVSNLMMGRAAETWDSQVRHELEEDLKYRGEEYKWAITQFWAANNRPPTKLEDLCPESNANRRFIRRCWNDPTTGEELRLIHLGEQGRRRKQNEARRNQLDEEEAELLDGFAPRERNSSRREREGPTVSDVEYDLPGQESRIEIRGDRPFIGVASDSDEPGFSYIDGTNVYSEWEFIARLGDVRGNQVPRGGGRANPTPTPRRAR